MRKATILLIEDNNFQATEVRSILEAAQYEVIWAESGLAGLKAAKTKTPDLILLDVMLPEVDGHEVCRWLKLDEATRGTPIIMLTARGDVQDKVAGLTLGADDYLPKPFDAQELLARIYACLRTKSLQDELRAKNLQLEGLLKQVEQMAITDSLTQLFNRRHFIDILDREFARAKRFNFPLACMMLDIDHFKQVNDTYGHHVGDQVLQTVGAVMQEASRQIEVAARYGGEEFVMLLPQTPLKDAMKPALRILERIASHRFDPFPVDKNVTVSIGVTGLPDSAIRTKEELIQCADQALYRSKRAGRNRIETCSGLELGKPF